MSFQNKLYWFNVQAWQLSWVLSPTINCARLDKNVVHMWLPRTPSLEGGGGWLVVTTEYIYIYNYRLHLRNDSVDVVVVVVVDGGGGIHLHLQLQATSMEQYRHRGFPAPPLDWPNVLWLIIPCIAKVSVSSLYSPSQNVPVSLPINKHSRVSVQLDWCLNHTIVFR